MKGVEVTVIPKIAGQPDRFGNVAYTDGTPVKVGGVLIAPGPTRDLDASRPEGVVVAYSLHFPKTYTGSLEGSEIALPAPCAGRYRVIGDPGVYMDVNTPGRWHMPVEVEAAHG